MKRLDDQEDERFVKAAVYGPPGTGKTNFGVTAPKPLIALSERQGMTHIRQAAKRLGVPVPHVVFMQDANDYRALARSLHGDKSKPFQLFEYVDSGEKDGNGNPKRTKFLVHEGEWPETVVIDSMTDACRLFVEEIRRESPPTRGRDGLPVDSQRFWNVLPTRVESMIHAFRDLPLHVLFLALADDREHGTDDNKVRKLEPMMPMRKLPASLCAAVNVMGYTYRTSKSQGAAERKIEYGIQTTGPEFMMVKPYRPLRDHERPDFNYWINVIRGDVEALPAPLPSQESGGGDVGPEDQPLTVGAGDDEAPASAPRAAADAEQSEPAAAPAEPKVGSKKKRKAS